MFFLLSYPTAGLYLSTYFLLDIGLPIAFTIELPLVSVNMIFNFCFILTCIKIEIGIC